MSDSIRVTWTALVIAVVVTVCCFAVQGCAVPVGGALPAQSEPSQSDLETGKVACTADSPKIPFTALGTLTTLTGEQGPPTLVCRCVGGRYACFGAEVPDCESTVVVPEVVVTPCEQACHNPKWIGHQGKDWVWCCSQAT